MQVVILCGGKGTRLSEYTESIPKPLIEIGNKPILWHIIQMYKSFGFRDFIFCLGYKGDKIKEYFNANKNKDVKIEFKDTGLETSKAERIIKVKSLINSEDFFVTYGDDLSDVNLTNLYEYHKSSKKIVTLTAIRLVSPFGILEIDNDEVVGFREKPKLEHYMNGGFYVFSKKIFDHLKKSEDLESGALSKLAKARQVAAFKHDGFWKSMNTLKDVVELNELFNKREWPWKK